MRKRPRVSINTLPLLIFLIQITRKKTLSLSPSVSVFGAAYKRLSDFVRKREPDAFSHTPTRSLPWPMIPGGGSM